MADIQYNGRCSCGNVHVSTTLGAPPSDYSPRLCDCDFCRQHDAAYVSDPDGALQIIIDDHDNVQWLRQGAEIARFLECTKCAKLVAVTYEEDGAMYAALNGRILEIWPQFRTGIAVSPKRLSPTEKTERWKSVWFKNVTIKV